MKTKKEITLKDLNYIIDNFDFEKVAALMKLTNWKWSNFNNSFEVPTIEQIKYHAEDLLFIAYNKIRNGKECTFLGGGGFNVYVFDYGIKLSFELSQKSNF